MVVALLVLLVLVLLIAAIATKGRLLHIALVAGFSLVVLVAVGLSGLLGYYPLPLRGEFKRVTGVDAPGPVWGTSSGFGDYHGVFTVEADESWVASAVATMNLEGGGVEPQYRCLSVGLPWWVERRRNEEGRCWTQKSRSSILGDSWLFFVPETGRVTIQHMTY